MYQKLRFRRQFLLTEAAISAPDGWACLNIDRYYLFSHPDLEVCRASDTKQTVVLVGEIYDPEEPKKENLDILEDILVSRRKKDDFSAVLKRYAGCYALIYKTFDKIVILHDPRALREIYYCTEPNEVICGSQPNLLAEFSTPSVNPSNDPGLHEFYENHLYDSKWIGDQTYFQGIKCLMPDHYLDITKRSAHRYWPSNPIERLDLNEAVSRSCFFLQGMMNAITHRHSAMMAVTSGTDSRALLAASRDVRHKIHYFINDIGLGSDHPDIAIPRKIFERIDVPFHVYDIPKDVDHQFRMMYLNNTFLASELYLPAIYHVYFKRGIDKALILGVGELGRTYYGKNPGTLNSYLMAYRLGYRKSAYAISQCEAILPEVSQIAKKYHINAMDFLHWEQRLGPWGAVRNSESNMAIEKIDPYNSHLMNEIFLGVDDRYKNPLEHPSALFKEMIRQMWPELLAWPINPPYNTRDKVRSFLMEARVWGLLKGLQYYFRYGKYRYRKWRNRATSNRT